MQRNSKCKECLHWFCNILEYRGYLIVVENRKKPENINSNTLLKVTDDRYQLIDFSLQYILNFGICLPTQPVIEQKKKKLFFFFFFLMKDFFFA